MIAADSRQQSSSEEALNDHPVPLGRRRRPCPRHCLAGTCPGATGGSPSAPAAECHNTGNDAGGDEALSGAARVARNAAHADAPKRITRSTQPRVRRIERATNPNDQQRGAFDDLKNAYAKAGDTFAAGARANVW